jgi:hypothetical protein
MIFESQDLELIIIIRHMKMIDTIGDRDMIFASQ